MLNKDVCRNCLINKVGFWDEIDNEMWHKRDIVVCPRCVRWIVSRRTYVVPSALEAPPDWCPHKFEHAIAAGMTGVE